MRFDKETIATIIQSMIYSTMVIGASLGFVLMIAHAPLFTFVIMVVMTIINSFTLITERKQREAKDKKLAEEFSKLF